MNQIRILANVYGTFFTWVENYHLKNEPRNQVQMILKSLKITVKQIDLFLYDFIAHCFPSLVMSLVSFKNYLRKYCEFSAEEKRMRRLFNGCANYIEDFGSFVWFDMLILRLTYIDYECPPYEHRFDFIFRYYDFDRDGYLSEEELREMIEDIHKNETSDMIDSIVNDYWIIISPSDKGVDYDIFRESVHNHTLIIPGSLCRIKFRILAEIISTLETRNRGIVSRIKTFLSHYCCQINVE